MKITHSLIIVFFCVQLERLHRYVFDNIYLQRHRTTKIDRMIVLVYNSLFKLFPYFRQYLKHFEHRLRLSMHMSISKCLSIKLIESRDLSRYKQLTTKN